MTNEQIDRLLPFLKGFSAKSKLIIFLLASKYSPASIRKIKIRDLNKIKSLHKVADLARCVELLDSGDSYVFAYPSGRGYSESYILSVLERSYERCNLKYKSLNNFIKEISGKK